MQILQVLGVVLVAASSAFTQAPPAQAPGAPPPGRGRQGPPPLGPNGTRDPFPNPIPADAGVIKVNVVEFAALPDVEQNTARPMLMSYEPGTRRLFVNDMHGALYSVSLDGKAIVPYLDHRDPRWNLQVQFENFERGFQSFAFHRNSISAARGDTGRSTPTPIPAIRSRRRTSRRPATGSRITPCCSNGPRRIPPLPRTMATLRAC